MGRLGHVDEIADVIRFLTSTEARFITGQIVAVDAVAHSPPDAAKVLFGREVTPTAAPVHAIGDIQALLHAALAPRDVLITMGAGDIGKIAHGFDKRFRKDRAAG